MRILIFFLCFSSSLFAEDPHKLTVNGSGVVMKPADQWKMTIGVVTQDKSVQKAIQSNREKMAQVIAALQKAGISESEYKTGTFQLEPQYQQPPKNPPYNWHPEIVGYEVRNALTLETGKLELVGPTIDAVVQQGANLIQDFTFTLQDMQPAKNEAITQAVSQARTYAESAAKEAAISLGPILEMTVNPSVVVPRAMRMEKMAMAEATTPISPGDIEITAHVSMVFGIKNQNE